VNERRAWPALVLNRLAFFVRKTFELFGGGKLVSPNWRFMRAHESSFGGQSMAILHREPGSSSPLEVIRPHGALESRCFGP